MGFCYVLFYIFLNEFCDVITKVLLTDYLNLVSQYLIYNTTHKWTRYGKWAFVMYFLYIFYIEFCDVIFIFRFSRVKEKGRLFIYCEMINRCWKWWFHHFSKTSFSRTKCDLFSLRHRLGYGLILIKRDYYFRVTFDHFWSNNNFLIQLGQLWKLGLI